MCNLWLYTLNTHTVARTVIKKRKIVQSMCNEFNFFLWMRVCTHKYGCVHVYALHKPPPSLLPPPRSKRFNWAESFGVQIVASHYSMLFYTLAETLLSSPLCYTSFSMFLIEFSCNYYADVSTNVSPKKVNEVTQVTSIQYTFLAAHTRPILYQRQRQRRRQQQLQPRQH